MLRTNVASDKYRFVDTVCKGLGIRKAHVQALSSERVGSVRGVSKQCYAAASLILSDVRVRVSHLQRERSDSSWLNGHDWWRKEIGVIGWNPDHVRA